MTPFFFKAKKNRDGLAKTDLKQHFKTSWVKMMIFTISMSLCTPPPQKNNNKKTTFLFTNQDATHLHGFPHTHPSPSTVAIGGSLRSLYDVDPPGSRWTRGADWKLYNIRTGEVWDGDVGSLVGWLVGWFVV